MADYLKRAFRSQLTSTIDSLLKTTLIEITRIFEDSLHDHQVELAKKAEHISRLQLKLEWSENKLRETGSVDLELDKSQASGDTQDLQTNVGISSDIQYGVPDWCAPLDCEIVDIQSPWTSEMDDQCPSVSLRPLSVSLLRIPDIKEEVEDEDYNSSLVTSPKKGCTPHKKWKHSSEDIQNFNFPRSAPKRRRGSTKSAIMQEKPEQEDMMGVRKSGRDHPGTKERRIIKNIKRTAYVYDFNSEQSEEQQATSNNSVKTYRCKFCHKLFDTEFGRSVHIRSHKKCKYCQKVFPYPSLVRIHMKSCVSYKEEGTSKIAELVRQAKPRFVSTKKTSPTTDDNPVSPQKNLASDDHNPVSPQKNLASDDHNPVSPPKITPTEDNIPSYKKHSCSHCPKTFSSHDTLQDHMQRHTVKRLFTCIMCPRKFRMKKSLKMHILNFHKNEKCLVANGDLAWLSSAEEVEETKVQFNLPSKEQSVADESKEQSVADESKEQSVADESKDGRRSRRKKKRRNQIWWETMGEQGPKGFICSVCNKTLSTKYMLVSHFRIHTGEKPIACDLCDETFRCHQLKCMHKKKYHGSHTIHKKYRRKISTKDKV